MPISKIKGNAIEDDAITSARLDDGTIVAVDLASEAVNTSKMSGLTSSSSGIIKADGDGTMSVTTADLVDDTTPQLGGDLDGNGNTIDLGGNTESLGLPVGTTAQQPSANEGHIRYDSDKAAVMYSDGTNWYKISSVTATLNSVSGTIYAGATSTLTLSGEGFQDANLVVNFTQSSDGIDEDVTVTPASDTSATVTVPANVYNNVTGGNAVTITVTNSDLITSEGVNTTAIGLPTGGTITTDGSDRIHTFTSSGSFVVPSGSSVSNIEYLVIAGGGGGNGHGGGGAGGYRCSVVGETSGQSSSAESRLTRSAGSYTVTVGAGSASGTGSNSVFDTITSNGGGVGQNNTGGNGGSGGGGGGSGSNHPGGSGTSGQGYGGGSGRVAPSVDAGGGGGGAGASGATATVSGTYAYGANGGSGITSSITGSAVTRAGGGGGYGTDGGSGGAGGGGTGRDATSADSSAPAANATDGTVNTGSGGGGSGGAGGSGIVIIRYGLSDVS